MVKLREKGDVIPVNVVEDLRAARTLIEIIRAGGEISENATKVEELLGRVEAFLVSTAEARFGNQFINSWMDEMMKIRRGELKWKPKVVRRFIPGLPRDKDWIRIKISNIITKQKVDEIVRDLKLQVRMQRDGYLLVSGSKDEVKRFVKRVTDSIRKG